MTAPASALHIGLVIEGVGDLRALPELLRRHMHSRGDYRDLLGKPVPLHGGGNASKASGIEGYVAPAASRPGCRGVLVVLDSDGKCIKEMAEELISRLQDVSHKPFRLALAERDFEDWLYCSAETLGLSGLEFDPGKRGLGEIRRALKPGTYTKPVHQPRFASRLSLDVARPRSESLDRAIERFEELLELLPDTAAPS